MKRVQKIIGVCLTFILILSMIPVPVFATEETVTEPAETSEVVTEQTGSNHLELTSYVGTKTVNASVETKQFSDAHSNVKKIGAVTQGALPCIGNPKVLVFYTTFPGGTQNWMRDPAGVEEIFFSEEPGSLRNFYHQSSYGKVDITGTVYEYTTQYDTSHYTDLSMVLNEIIAYYKDSINWSDYDTNSDGYIDGIYVVARTKHSWGGPNFVAAYSAQVDGVGICKACFIDSEDLATICHETCHMFGPADMYASVGVNPSGIMIDCIMDGSTGPNSLGDLPGITKFVLGWIDEPNFISGTGTFELTLNSYSTDSELAIIYPNGDASNANWMIVEYVTAEANNYYDGIRIWKSNMNLDENFNIKGSTEFCDGMPSSPYEFLECVHPDGVRNHIYKPGDSITPYTYPSTSYAQSYYLVGSAKYMRDLAHSGISIFVNDYDGDSASITVEIDNSAKKPPVNAEFIPGNVTAEYINDVSGVLVGTLIAECELAAPADISLEDPATGAKIPLVTELTANSRELSLYVDAEHIDKLKANTQYDLNLESRVFTYFGGAVSIKDFDNRISLPQIPYPMVKAASFDHICSHNYELGRSPDLFNPDSTQISFFCHSDNCLWLNLFDISTNEVRNLELEMPSYQDKSLSPEKVLMIDNAYYLVVFKMRNSRFMSHAVLYDLQGDLLDDYVFESSIIYVGLHGSAVFLDENADKFLEITVKDRQITLTDLNTLANTRGMYKRIGAYKVTSTDLALFEDTMELDLLRVVETSSGTVLYERKLDTGMDTVYLDIVSHNGKLYVAMLGDTIRLITLNNKYELIKEENLLANHGATFYDKIYFDFTEEGSWLTFDAVASTNAISYSSTFLLTLSETGDVENYYRYGDASFRFCGNVIYLGDGKFFLVGEMNEYFLLSKDERIASQRHKWKAADCTKPKTCTVCGATEGKPVGHIYNNGVDGTCNVCSIHRETTEDRTVMHMFRMYDPNSGEHFYTGSEVERDNLVAEGWNYEGVGFTFSMTTGMPVYRLYDPITGEHLYTMNVEEKAMLMAQGWNFEGIAFNSAYDTEVPQYRLHNPNETRGAYHFTASIEERDYLLSLGWEDQGIGFYSSWK